MTIVSSTSLDANPPSQALPSRTGFEQVTGPPFITLVDLEGFGVPDAERFTPTCGREPCPADSWPAWTDLVTVQLGGRDFEHQVGGAKLGDAYRRILESADGEPDMIDADDDIDALVSDWEPADDAPDADPAIAFPGTPSLAERQTPSALIPWGRSGLWDDIPPIRGGSSETEPFEPDPADWDDYRRWSESLEMKRWYDANPVSAFNACRADA